VMRVKNPAAARPFKTPLVPLVPILGAGICLALIIGLDYKTQLMAIGWLLFGLVIYFGYSKKNSVLRKAQ
ncbi:MAG: amino acid permease C-terminal domain-containing protein, partial [Cytophagales bacterium]